MMSSRFTWSAVLFLVVALVVPVALGQFSGNLITQDVELISIDYENKIIRVRARSSGERYGAQVEEKTKLKAKKKLIGGKDKPVLEDFQAGDIARIRVLIKDSGQTLKELRLLKKAPPKT